MSGLSYEQCEVAMNMPLRLRESSAPGVDTHLITMSTGQQYEYRWWRFSSHPTAEFIELVDAVAVWAGATPYAVAEKLDIDVRLSAIVSVAKLPPVKKRRKAFCRQSSQQH
jgi:hypothetical protein